MRIMFIICTLLFSFSIASEAQKTTSPKQIAKEIIELRDHFMSSNYDAEKTLKTFTSWKQPVCDCTPPETIEEIQDEPIEKPKYIYRDRYFDGINFYKNNILGIHIRYNRRENTCLLRVYAENKNELKDLRALAAFVRKNGTKVTDQDYAYLDSYFRINTYNSSPEVEISILETKTYPQGFEEKIQVPVN